ncbi:phosphonopyruvate decarboxylase [Nonomuraea candida]|uniref:phosphonopyruvate decarboxylase n=1 Tax=Nonomuraea candida TaxID=359159 RepID=UPI000694B880|nr:phosphonopyruvate decarboxylase [Nonomuraea candida]
MIDAQALLNALTARGVTDTTGVPCSYLTPLINRVAAGPGYLPATHEGEAVAIASGCWLAGVTACVIAQNSGLGNMVNPLTSLNHPAEIPVPLVVTWRGEPGRPDEPQHELMGEITGSLLDLMRIGHALVPGEESELDACLDAGWAAMDLKRRPHAFVLRDGIVRPEPLREKPPPAAVVPDVTCHGRDGGGPPTRAAALERLLAALPDTAAVVSTTGKTSRELYTIADRPQHFYMVGAMGSASAVGLGVARHTSRPVVVVDGDGAALMRLGTMAAVGAHASPNLTHVLLDNGVHDSTGGQRSLAQQVDFPAVAAACGYARVHRCGDLAGFGEALRAALEEPGPALVHLRILPGSMEPLGRPRVHPSEVARRFRDFVTEART